MKVLHVSFSRIGTCFGPWSPHLAEVGGGGMSADAYHLTASHPDGLGAKLVMRNALEDAGMAPEDIDYINVHGTSTPVAISQRLRRSKMCSENMLIN